MPILGFNENKELIDISDYKDKYFSHTVVVEGKKSITYEAPANGYAWAALNTATSSAVVRNGQYDEAGAYMTLQIDDQVVGNFYCGKGERSYKYTPAFPIKAGSVITLKNGYSDTTVGLELNFLSLEELE